MNRGLHLQTGCFRLATLSKAVPSRLFQDRAEVGRCSRSLGAVFAPASYYPDPAHRQTERSHQAAPPSSRQFQQRRRGALISISSLDSSLGNVAQQSRDMTSSHVLLFNAVETRLARTWRLPP